MSFYAGGFLYNPDSQEILLHFRDNKTKNNPNTWAFFGGLSEGDEKPEETFIREVFEELEISLDTVTYLRDYLNPDFATHRYVYVANVEEKPQFHLHEGEKASWFTLEKALQLQLTKLTREDLLYLKAHLQQQKER